MNRELCDALESCLQRLEQGEPLEAVLSHHPGLHRKLRPLLLAATHLHAAGQADLPAGMLARQRSRGLVLAAKLREGRQHSLLGFLWKKSMTIAAVIAVLVMSTNGLLVASARALPGDRLYPLKRGIETSQLRFTLEADKKISLEHQFDERRVEETQSLINVMRAEPVEFSGRLTDMQEHEWLVSGIPVRLTDETIIEPGIEIGDEVEVDGMTTSLGLVEATHLLLARDHNDIENLPELPSQQLERGMQPENRSESSEEIASSEPTEYEHQDVVDQEEVNSSEDGSAETTPLPEHSSESESPD